MNTINYIRLHRIPDYTSDFKNVIALKFRSNEMDFSIPIGIYKDELVTFKNRILTIEDIIEEQKSLNPTSTYLGYDILL